MGDGALSQDDIDNLLSGGFDDMAASGTEKTDSSAQENSAPPSDSSQTIFDDLDALIGGGESKGSSAQPTAKKAKAKPQVSSGAMDINKQGNLPILTNVFINLHVELGKKTLMIKDILVLGEGSIIELDKAAGEPVDILANNRPLARGEVVVVDEQFGVRVTEMVDPLKA
jgi:flagellar motor switch protein FliN/FliY